MSKAFRAVDPNFESRVRDSFARQGSMRLIGARIERLAPGDGDKLVASGQVKKSGRTLTVCEFEVAAIKQGARTLCACGIATLLRIADRPGRPKAGRSIAQRRAGAGAGPVRFALQPARS